MRKVTSQADRFLAFLTAILMIVCSLPVSCFPVYAGTSLGSGSSVKTSTTAGIYLSLRTSGGGDGTAEMTISSGGAVIVPATDDDTLVLHSGEDARVKAGTSVQVKFAASPGSYLASVKKNDKKVESGNITFNATEDTEYEAVFEKYRIYTVTKTEGGKVTLNNRETSSRDYKKNAAVSVAVTADAGYCIASVAEDGTEKTVSPGAVAYSWEEKAGSDTDIEVTFLKLYDYCLTYYFDGSEWTAEAYTVTGTAVQMPLPEEQGKRTVFAANAEDGYRLASRRMENVSGMAADDFSMIGSEDEPQYDDYSISVSAALQEGTRISFYYLSADWYDFTLPSDTENGSVYFAPDDITRTRRVMRNGTTGFYLEPDFGYTVESLRIGDADCDLSLLTQQTTAGDALFWETDPVDCEKTVEVVFAPSTPAAISDVLRTDTGLVRLITTDAAVTDTCIYTTLGSVCFTATTDRMRVQYADAQNGIHTEDITSGAGLTFTENTTILQMAVYRDKCWHIVRKNDADYQVEVVIDGTAPSVALVPASFPNASGYYTGDFDVALYTSDAAVSSGIQSVRYQIFAGGVETCDEMLYAYHEGDASETELSFTKTVDASANESDSVRILLTVADRAGNVSSAEHTVKINTVAPQISVEMTGTASREAYFTSARTATITILDRDDCFSADNFNFSILQMTDGSGTAFSPDQHPVVLWKTVTTPGVHVGEVAFTADANYQWTFDYASGSGLTPGAVTSSGACIFSFTIDSAAPTLTIKGTYSDITIACMDLMNTLTFHYCWDTTDLRFSVDDIADDTSGVEKDVEYYTVLVRGSSYLSTAELDALYAQGKFSAEEPAFTNETYVVVYARVEDRAGNYAYYHTGGIVAEKTESVIQLTPRTASVNGYYTGDFTVDVFVNDQTVSNGVYSGVKKVSYEVILGYGSTDASVCQSGVLFDVNSVPAQQPQAVYSGSVTVAVNSGMTVTSAALKVTACDMTSTSSIEYMAFSLNTVTPEASLAFKGEDASSQTGAFYTAPRTAVLTVTDRNECFDPDAFLQALTFTAVDSQNAAVSTETAITIGSWTTDGDVHTLEILFGDNQTDGNFQWNFGGYVDRSGLTISAVNVASAVHNPWQFTVDRGVPAGQLTVKNAGGNVIASTSALQTDDETKLFINPDRLELSAVSSDAISGTSVSYFLASGPAVLTEAQLDDAVFVPFSGLTVNTSDQLICYLKVTDEAGNDTYISSDLYINDQDKPVTELSAKDADGETPVIYKKDVEVSYDINDMTGGVSSGIREIRYWVGTTSSAITQKGVLYKASSAVPVSYEERLTATSGSITVDSAKNRAAAVQAHIIVTDFAGNVSDSVKCMDILYSNYSSSVSTGGSISFNDDESSVVRLYNNKTVNVEIAADAGYYIREVKRNGVSLAVADGAETWERSETVSGDTVYEVVFEKLYDYCLTFTFEGGEWTVSSSIAEEDLSGIDLPGGSSLTVEAPVKQGYRLASGRSVENGVSLFSRIGTAEAPQYKAYMQILSGPVADGFVIKYYYLGAEWYTITLPEKVDNGKIGFAGSSEKDQEVMFNADIQYSVTPDFGYQVSSIRIGAVQVPMSWLSQPVVTSDELVFTWKNLKSGAAPDVSFVLSEPGAVGEIIQNHEGRVRLARNGSKDTCVYTTSGVVSFDTTADRLRIFYTDKDNTEHVVETVSGSALTFAEDMTVTKFAVYRDMCWHIVRSDNGMNYQMDIVHDVTAPAGTIDPESANASGYYNDDFTVSISAGDGGAAPAGLESVLWTVFCGDEKTAEKMLYQHEAGGETIDHKTLSTTVSAVKNESDKVKLQLTVTDLAGNTTVVSSTVKINTIAPQVSVSVNGQDNAAHPGYFCAPRTATITILDRDDCFNTENVTFTLKKMTDASGVRCSYATLPAIVWKDGTQTGQHIGEIIFAEDANYEWSLSYISGSGLAPGEVQTSGSAIYKFTVDKTAPTVSLQAEYGTVVEKCISFCNLLTFNSFWKAEQVRFSGIDGSDATSGLEPLQYYVCLETSSAALTVTELDALFVAGAFSMDKPVVDADSYAVVYVRAEDYAGNVTYAHTGGIVIDNTASDITILPAREKTGGYYTSDFDVDITVTDQITSGAAFAGVKKVVYEVLLNPVDHAGTICQSGVLYDNSTGQDGEPKAVWTDTLTIAVNSANNAPSAELLVTAEDFAGTTSSAIYTFAINTLTPEVALRFENEDKTAPASQYFAASRKAVLTVTDRKECFDAAAFEKTLTFAAVDYAGNSISTDTAIRFGSWTQPAGQPDTHIVEITFGANDMDANFTWQFNGFTDLSGLTVGAVDVSEAAYPWAFSVDRVVPNGRLTVKNTSGTAIFAETEKLLSSAEARLFITSGAIVFSGVSSDATTATEMAYYLASGPALKTRNELTAVPEGANGFRPFSSFTAASSDCFYLYMKVTDAAGNDRYISSDLYIKDGDAPRTTLTAAGKDQQARTMFNEDVTVTYHTNDLVNGVYSGIREIRYWVGTSEESKTQEAVVLTRSAVSSYKDLLQESTGSIVVDAEKNNSSGVQVHFIVTDNAGNVSDTSIVLDIDVTAPVISVRFKDGRTGGNFRSSRTAVVSIEERFDHFDPSKVLISGVSSANRTWTTGAAVQTCTLDFTGDAKYKLSISCTDAAGNSADPYSISFTVDKTAPSASIRVKTKEDKEKQWSGLASKELIGLVSKSDMSYTVYSSDATSGVTSVSYYIATMKKQGDKVSSLTASDLNKISEWKTVKDNTITGDGTSAIYVRVKDACGNETFVGTEGLLIDSHGPEISLTEDLRQDAAESFRGIYNTDVPVTIKVTEPVTDGSYSGLKEISYKVFDKMNGNPDVPTQEGVLYTSTGENAVSEWTGKITVDSAKNNSNDIRVVVYALDTAGNQTDNSQPESEAYMSLKIDRTAPVIDVTYDNNSAENGSFFRDVRTASVKVTERNFDPEEVELLITADGDMPAVSAWTHLSGGGNGDGDTHIATIQYAADGDYTFAASCSDMAGNIASAARYAEGTVAAEQFTVDRTLPAVQVVYNNNSVLNGNYFRAARRATITITDRNFTPSDVSVLITVRGGSVIPSTSAWTASGDTYTATVDFAADAFYTFDISCKDKAGNVFDSYSPDSFYIDQTPPELTISGVLDLSANNGDVIPVITCTDANYGDAPSITLTGALCGDVDPSGALQGISGGQQYTFENFEVTKESDDIYTLSAKAADKAGNETETSIRFSVNRFGSVYVLSNDTEVMNDRYVRAAGDVVLSEINADVLSEVQITLYKNGETVVLSEGSDYTVQSSGGDGSWYEYQYRISSALFDDDGVYRLTIHSVDAAGNTAENTFDTKDAEISFGVDKTLPLINVFNLENGVTYAVENMTAEFSVSDNLMLASLDAYLDGELCGSWKDADLDAVISEAGTFTVFIDGNTTAAHTLRLVAADAAGNEAEEVIDGFYVTTDTWTNFYNNKPLFYGAIGGTAAGCGGLAWLISALRKRRLLKLMK